LKSSLDNFLAKTEQDNSKLYHYITYFKKILVVVNSEGDGSTTDIVLPAELEV
jgi:hypothetical protein